MKIVFVSFYEAYPPVSGAASVSWNVAKYFNGDRTLIQIGRQDSGIRNQDEVNIITLQGFDENRLKKLLRIPGWILQIVGHIKRIDPDIIVLEGASWVLYHWLLIKAIRLLAKPVRLIYHSHNVEYILRKEKHNQFIVKITRFAERRILHEVDTATAVSPIDSHQFELLYGIKPKILPNGVDIDTFNHVSTVQIQTVKKKYELTDETVLFMGSYLYKPNQEAIDFLIKKVIPKVVQRQPDTRLAIVGGKVPYKKSWLINPGCIPFQDLPAFVKACTICAAPIFSGSGTRLKILEYMAAGKPVVATTKGAEGLDVKDGKHILLADSSDGFVKAISKLLTDSQFSSSIGEKGYNFISSNYSWDHIIKEFVNVQGSLQP